MRSDSVRPIPPSPANPGAIAFSLTGGTGVIYNPNFTGLPKPAFSPTK